MTDEPWKGHQGHKKSFSCCIRSEKLNKENVDSLLNGVGDLMIVNTGKAEVFKTFFASFFANETSLPRPLEKWFQEKNSQQKMGVKSKTA